MYYKFDTFPMAAEGGRLAVSGVGVTPLPLKTNADKM